MSDGGDFLIGAFSEKNYQNLYSLYSTDDEDIYFGKSFGKQFNFGFSLCCYFKAGIILYNPVFLSFSLEELDCLKDVSIFVTVLPVFSTFGKFLHGLFLIDMPVIKPRPF